MRDPRFDDCPGQNQVVIIDAENLPEDMPAETRVLARMASAAMARAIKEVAFVAKAASDFGESKNEKFIRQALAFACPQKADQWKDTDFWTSLQMSGCLSGVWRSAPNQNIELTEFGVELAQDFERENDPDQ